MYPEADHIETFTNAKLALPADGERYLPGMGGRIAAEHLARYAFAARFVAGKAVLDIASGEGYGTAILARLSKTIVGIDVDKKAVDYSEVHYSSAENASFKLGDISDLSEEVGRYDTVISFETIEHVDDPYLAITQLSKALRPGGVLLVSTPNSANYSDRYDYSNPYHLRELTFIEFRDALFREFKHVKFFGQYSGIASEVMEIDDDGSLSLREELVDISRPPVSFWTGKDKTLKATPLYFVAVCSNEPISEFEMAHVSFLDPTDWQAIDEEFALRDAREQIAKHDVNSAMLKKQFEEIENSRDHLVGENANLNNLLSSLQNENEVLREDYAVAERELDRLRNDLEVIQKSRMWRFARCMKRMMPF